MAFRGDDDWRGKQKMAEPRDKDPPQHGHGRTAAGSSSAAGVVQQAEGLLETRGGGIS